jgi:holo-ACP synthase/triphosphoribosyl-dephospho-CoA synthase
LAAREQRALLKKQLVLKGFPCVSLSLNVPGFPKSNETTHLFFDSCLHDLTYFLKAHLVEIQHKEVVEMCDAAGDFFIAPCSSGRHSPVELKQLCEDFEESHPLGRFIDVDLNDAQGNTISSGKSKLCFFCREKPAIECRRLNVHDPEQLRSFMFAEMNKYCCRQREHTLAKRFSSMGLKALLYEISLTPKPGLVDKFSNGSHSDMNYQTFIDSSVAISQWFNELVYAGFAFRGNDYTKVLPLIRNIGLRMESAMYEATQNVNTQKGIIFLMGLSLFACGKLYSQNDRFDEELFRSIIRDSCKDLVAKELSSNFLSGKSHGEVIFQKYGFGGARGEAESGLELVFECGLPQLSGLTALNDEALIKCFLAIASRNNDTNILYRRGPEVLAAFQGLCKTAAENFSEANYSKVMEFCKSENISPGGSADLLALSIFIWLVMNADRR